MVGLSYAEKPLIDLDLPGILIRMRKPLSSSDGEVEVDVLTRVAAPAHDLFLRLDLSYFQKVYEKHSSSLSSSSSSAWQYVAEIYDGWWKTTREYNFWKPLSANYQPVSESMTLSAARSGAAASQSSTDFVLSLVPSHPLGMVVFKQYVEVMAAHVETDSLKIM